MLLDTPQKTYLTSRKADTLHYSHHHSPGTTSLIIVPLIAIASQVAEDCHKLGISVIDITKVVPFAII